MFDVCINLCRQTGLTCVLSLVSQELLAQEKSQTSTAANQEVDLDELMDVS